MVRTPTCTLQSIRREKLIHGTALSEPQQDFAIGSDRLHVVVSAVSALSPPSVVVVVVPVVMVCSWSSVSRPRLGKHNT